MSASSNSQNQVDQTLDDSSNPNAQSHSQPQILEPLNPTNQENPQNQETPEVILDEKDQENPDQKISGAADTFPNFSLNVVLPIADSSEVSVPDPPLMSPTTTTTTTHKRIKRKKGKASTKKLQAIEKRLLTLKQNLKPLPFFPSKILDFGRHEKLLKRLGLWDFVHIEFDRDLRVDLIAQLIATYDSKLRYSYVNDFRILVNRADLARALKLPVKKDRGSVDGLDLDADVLSEESIGFLEDFVSIWVLLHEDTFIMPNEVLNWIKTIKDGHPERVDWAGLFWFMVEKELMKGDQLVDCYYAAHLQYLIKSQREEVLFGEEPEKMEFEVAVKEEDDCVNEDNAKVGGSSEAQQEDRALDEGLNFELTLGQDLGQKKEGKDVEMMDVEEQKEEEEGEEEQHRLFYERTDANEPLLQRCKMQEAVSLDNDEEKKEDHELADDDEEEEEGAERDDVEDGFDVMPSDDTLVGDGLTGNLLQAMETSQIAFTSQGQLHDQSSVELLASRAEMHTGGSFFGSGSKREIEIEPDHSLNGSNKRLRNEGAWDQKPLDFGSCMEQMQQLMMRARMMYESKEQNEEQFNMNQQLLINELHKRDSVIEHLHKSRYEEVQRKDEEICRLERELFIMGNILDGYRKALKDTQKQFSEYRQKFHLPEEPYYKDAGPGGLMLSTAEIEKLRLKQEEENRSICLLLEQKAKEAEEEYASQFEVCIDKVQMLDKRLMNLEDEMKDLKNLRSKSKVPKSEDEISETPDCPPNE
ncbi:PREDICTED: uncharacterized protein LOC109233106 [Nicotiana attenuata]|uniref:Uncharacterized protein n=1 Tax=Nicotiana attenuata TaxID=49451 RepID=A0A1J6HXZ3_NICAT|nr:PREDICTED: uncharacterized protein LOC109233106 [Nicotiana attenuata]XP_019254415.1 PREDICTED: uncharacterized protein LOC109233106 [Nicotiana attenuata]OIS97724.1 hypothetical protein A4A49_08769 [Nicotiana attenuata]